VPVDGMKPDVAGDKRGVEIVIALHVLVHVTAKLLHKTTSTLGTVQGSWVKESDRHLSLL